MTNIFRMIDRTVNGRDLLRIEIEIREGDPCGLSDGFSITGSVWEARGTHSGASRARQGRDIDMGGCIHEMILAAAPELAPVVAVHLADLDGTPMHAAANGWYFYTGRARQHDLVTYGQAYVDRLGTAHDQAARALHISPAELPEGMDKAGFDEFVASLAPRWAQMAAEARALIVALPDVYQQRGYDAYGKAIK
jgi:hypothetical protein